MLKMEKELARAVLRDRASATRPHVRLAKSAPLGSRGDHERWRAADVLRARQPPIADVIAQSFRCAYRAKTLCSVARVDERVSYVLDAAIEDHLRAGRGNAHA